MASRAWVAVACGLCVAGGMSPSLAQEAQPTPPIEPLRLSVTANDYGGVGLLQTRTARFARDGNFDVGYSFVDPYKRYYFNLTFFPWLEATFRYTEIRNKLYSNDPSFSGDQRYKDRGADLKVRLLPEGHYRPALAVGFQDLLGTGIFAGEYLVASKQWSDFDFSLGVGWGRLGSGGNLRNPAIAISDQFRERRAPTGTGGQLAFNTFFAGETVGIFGGVEYRTPFEGLSLKLEYDAQRYKATDLTLPSASPINYGLVFRPYSWLELSLGRERGNTTMLRVSLRTNFNDRGVPKFDPPPPPVEPRRSLEEIAPPAAPPAAPAPPMAAPPGAARPAAPPATPVSASRGEALFDILRDHGMAAESFGTRGSEAFLAVARLDARGDALGAVGTLILADLPVDIGELTLVDMVDGRERERVRITRTQLGSSLPIDRLYQRLAAGGLDLVDLSLSGNAARLAVLPRQAGGVVDLATAARVAAEALPGVTTVTAVNGINGGAETWIAFADTPRLDNRLLAEAPRVALAGAAGQEFRTSTGEVSYTAQQRATITAKMNDALRHEGAVLEALDLEPRRAFVALTLFRYREVSRNLGIVARVVANNLPANIEEITLAMLNAGFEQYRITFLRGDLERAAALMGSPEEIWLHARVEPGHAWQPGDEVPWRYPYFSWSIGPQLRQHIGGPDRFYLYQLWLSLNGNVDIARGLSLNAQVGKNIWHNFDKIKLASDSQLPHVRSEIKNYLQQGADNLVRLQLSYIFKPAEDVYARISAGILEEMFGGVSTEVLYRPFDSRVAFGVDMNWVRQRDFDQRFKFLDYKTRTGHFSIYYDTPFYNVLVATHIGQYLAGDKGVTFELSRLFDSGVRMGAWATFTNVTPQQFGEGSFDKGFYVAIPFDLFLTRSGVATGVFGFRPLTRDGGQRLVLSNRLYDMTGQTTYGAVARDWPQLMR